jgi:catechol 2,3-dioxygenase-like lactoylglutathione lyase family enzyme
MPHSKDLITALSVFAALPVSDLDSSIGWYTGLIGRKPDSRPMDGLAEYFRSGDRDPDRGTLQLAVDPTRAGGGLVTIKVADTHAVAAMLADNGIELNIDDTSSPQCSSARFSTPTETRSPSLGHAPRLAQGEGMSRPSDSAAIRPPDARLLPAPQLPCLPVPR